MNKIVEVLSKLGILKYGASSGTYRNAAEAPDDFEYMNMSGKKKDDAKENSRDISEDQQGSIAKAGVLDASLPVIIATWVMAALFWLIALGAFAEGKSLVGFWMVLAGLVTAHHTNKLLAMVGVDLSLLWRITVIVVCLFVAMVSI